MSPVIKVSGYKFKVPAKCPCCMERGEQNFTVQHTRYTGKKVIRSQTWDLSFNFCHRCLHHYKLHKEFKFLGWIIVLILAVGGIAFYNSWLQLTIGSSIAIALFFVVASILAFKIRAGKWEQVQAELKKSCATSDLAVTYMERFGTVSTLFFDNRDFARLFAQQNMKKVVNDSSTVKLIQESQPNESAEVCSSCGADFEFNDLFCSKCGQGLQPKSHTTVSTSTKRRVL